MPVALPADWPTIAALAASGVTLEVLSARFGIKLPTLQARSARGGWKRKAKEVQMQRVEAATGAGKMKSGAEDGLAVVHDTLADYSKKTRLNLAKGIDSASRHAATLNGDSALKSSRSLKETASAAAVIHGWHREGSQTIRLSMCGQQPIEVEAEFVQDDSVALVEGLSGAGTD